MRRLMFLLSFCMLFLAARSQSSSVGIGTSTPDNSAVFDVQSSNKGMLIPRMTTAQRNAISSPAIGLLVFDNTTGTFWFRNNNSWIELVDTANNTWKKSGTHAYAGVSGNIGIGTSSPTYDIHISRPAPSIGFYDAGNSRLSGIINGVASDMFVNAYRTGISDPNPRGNLILQVNRGLPQPLSAGNVGIGTSSPDVKLQIEDGANISAAAGGFLQIGASSGANIAIDENQFQARNNGAASRLYLQTTGGDLQIGGTNAVTINDGYQVYRNRPLSTNADLLPIAYAKIDGFSVAALSGTGNISVAKTDVGDYRLTLLGESNIYANRNFYSISVTANYTAVPLFANAEIQSDNKIHVTLAKPDVNWVNQTCDGCTASYIQNAMFWEYRDAPFTIIIYKQ